MSASIGLIIWWKDRNNEDEDNYATGGKSFSAYPVAFSIGATSMSAITMIGSPAEYYEFGSTYGGGMLSDIVSMFFAAFLYLPIYYDLGVPSVYAYLEIRFGYVSRKVTTALFLLQSILYNGIVIYSPALALAEVSGLDITASILVVGGVCISYTALGGIKAVIWTDVWQSMWMLSGYIGILVIAAVQFDSFS